MGLELDAFETPCEQFGFEDPGTTEAGGTTTEMTAEGFADRLGVDEIAR